MSHSSEPSNIPNDLPVADRIDLLCDAFERDWLDGKVPRLEEFLERIEVAGQANLFRELLRLDFDYRGRKGTAINQTEYIGRFPSHAKLVDEIFHEVQHHQAALTLIPQSSVNGSTLAERETSGAATNGRALRAKRSTVQPSKFGDFELLDEIARGGMGVVYKARQVSLNRIVALKMILAGKLASQHEVERFQTEAQAAAKLDHPGIVQVYGVGEIEGRHYYSMAFVEGQSLAKRVADGPLPPREAADIVRQVAEAVQYAHEHGVIHRDLKPHNILLLARATTSNTPQPDSTAPARLAYSATPFAPIPKVTDFGLAKQLEADSSLTSTGQILGTPSYMPPEQAQGRIRDIGPQSDVYSLGAILYCLLTGRPPFQAATVLETLQQVIDAEPVSLRQINAAIPADLETICHKCLSKPPGGRYPTARELADELTRFLNGESIHARPASRVERTGRWCRRNPVVAVLSVAVGLSLVIGTVVSAYFAIGEAHAAKSAKDNELRSNKLAKDEASQRRKADEQATLAKDETRRAKNLLLDMHFERANRFREEGNSKGNWNQLVATYGFLSAFSERDDWRAASARSLLGSWISSHSAIVQNHQDQPQCKFLAMKPDEPVTFLCSMNQTCWLCDAHTGAPIGAPMEFEDPVEAGAFSPDGPIVLTVSNKDFHVRIWNATQGALRGSPLIHDEPIASIKVSPDAQAVLTTTINGLFRLWSGSTGLPCGTQWREGHVQETKFSPDGQIVLISGWSNGNDLDRYSLRDTRTGALIGLPIRRISVWATSTSFRPDSRVLLTTGTLADSDDEAASKSGKTTIRLWDTSTGMPIGKPFRDRHIVGGFEFTPDGRSILIRDANVGIQLWDPKTWTQLEPSLNERTNHAAISPDGLRILTAGFDETTVRLWEIGARSFRFRNELKHTARISSLSFSSDGLTPLIRTYDENSLKLYLWVPKLGEQYETVRHEKYVKAIEFSPDSRVLLSGGEDGTARFWDMESFQMIGAPLRHPGAVEAVAFSPDGQTVAIAGSDKTAQLWDVKNRVPIGQPMVHDDVIRDVAFSPDGRTVLTGSTDKTARLWDARSSALLATLRHQHTVLKVAFNPSDQTILTAGETSKRNVGSEMNIQKWDAATHAPIGEPFGQQSGYGPFDLSITPDGATAIAAGGSSQTRLWDLRTGLALKVPLQHSSGQEVLSTKFSKDGLRVLTGGGLYCQLWDWKTGSPCGPPIWSQGCPVAMSPDGRTMATVDCGGNSVVRIWNAPSFAPEDAEWRRAGVEWQTGFTFNEDGELFPLNAKERFARWPIIEKHGGLWWQRSRDPSSEHLALAHEAEQIEGWFGACFHLRRLRELLPNDESIQSRLTRAETECEKLDTELVGSGGANDPIVDSKAWFYTTDGGGVFVKIRGGWVERRASGENSYFAEIEHKDNILELFDRSRNLTVRLHNDRMEWSTNKQDWNLLHKGEWRDNERRFERSIPNRTPSNPQKDNVTFDAIWVKDSRNVTWESRNHIDAKTFEQKSKGRQTLSLEAFIGVNAKPLFGGLWVTSDAPVSQMTRFNLSKAEFQTEMQKLGFGFRLTSLDIYGSQEQQRYAALWTQSRDETPWIMREELDQAALLAENTKLKLDGYRPSVVTGYVTDDQTVKFVGVWIKNQEQADLEILSVDEFKQRLASSPSDVFPIWLNAIGRDQSRTYAIIWSHSRPGTQWAISTSLGAVEFQKDFDAQVQRGFRPELLNAD